MNYELKNSGVSELIQKNGKAYVVTYTAKPRLRVINLRKRNPVTVSATVSQLRRK